MSWEPAREQFLVSLSGQVSTRKIRHQTESITLIRRENSCASGSQWIRLQAGHILVPEGVGRQNKLSIPLSSLTLTLLQRRMDWICWSGRPRARVRKARHQPSLSDTLVLWFCTSQLILLFCFLIGETRDINVSPASIMGLSGLIRQWVCWKLLKTAKIHSNRRCCLD